MTEDPRKIEYLYIGDLLEDSRNPKSHDLDTIDKSIGRFGVLDPIVRDGRTGFIISGHGRKKTLEAMQERGETPPEGVKVDEAGRWLVPVATGWASRTDSEAAAALIALNRTTELGGWVDDALLELLDDLSEIEDGLEGVGFSEQDREMLNRLAEEGHSSFDWVQEATRRTYETEEFYEEEEVEDTQLTLTGQNLKELDILFGEPKHKVHRHDKYLIGGRHYLVVATLSTEHCLWTDLLPSRVFAPYPDVYLLLGSTPKEKDFVLVQPNQYLAGHILDKWASIHGEDSIEKVK